VPQSIKPWARGVFALLVIQVFLGAWVSTNYAVLACDDFPMCRAGAAPLWDGQGFVLWRPLGENGAGQYLSVHALASIHWVHRLMAACVVVALLLLSLRLYAVQPLARHWRGLLCLVGVQAVTGISNVVLGWPLWAALLHTACAALLWTLLWGWSFPPHD
jgi:cytochrome c oxidase assembly protein subunit 15